MAKYFVLLTAADGSTHRERIDGRLNQKGMRRAALIAAWHREPVKKYTSYTIERENVPGVVFARYLPTAIKYPIGPI